MNLQRFTSSLWHLCIPFSVCLILCASCPLTNVTDEQLLRDNRALRFLYDQFSFKSGGKINLDGLKNLITQLYIITSCSSGGSRREFFRRPYSRFPQDNYGRRSPGYYNNDGYRQGHYRDYNYDRHTGEGYPHYHDRDHFPHHDGNQYPPRHSSGPLLSDEAKAMPVSTDHSRGASTDHSRGVSTDHSRVDSTDHSRGSSEKKDSLQRDEPYRPKGETYRPKGETYSPKGELNNGLGDTYRPKGDYDKRFDYKNQNYRRGSYPKGHGYMVEDCETIESAILNSGYVKEDIPLGPHELLHLCPAIVKAILNPPCEAVRTNLRTIVSRNTVHGYDERSHNHHHRHYQDYEYYGYRMTRDAWIGAILSLVLIGLIALMCILVIPVLKRSKYYIAINHFLLALAVGSLAGDALIHLLPHALTMELSMNISAHLAHALYGFTAFVGIMVFLMMEKLHNYIGHKHAPSQTVNASPENDEMIKELGVISSSELNETNPKRAATIGKKLSQHSKTTSFTHVDPNDQMKCFDNCPPNRGGPGTGTGTEDSNVNSGLDSIRKPRLPERHSSSTAEREKLVAINLEIKDKVSSTKGIKPIPIPPPPLIQNSSPKPMVRQDSKNFNMILQEYHIGHHGHSHHGHSHVSGKKDALRTMILLGDGIHTFIDGMAIGAAFGTSLTGGIATAIAVLCHELPHKVGDFAILFEMGMKKNQALKMVLILWLLSFCGLAVGVSLGSIQAVSPWIYCFTAGIFLYLALVDLLSELTITEDGSCSAFIQLLLQIGGMSLGALIMLVIAIYEHDLENLLEGSFETRDMKYRRYSHRAYNYKYDYNRP